MRINFQVRRLHNVQVSEPEEREVAALGLEVNMADNTVYPSSTRLHNDVVCMLAKLWHAPTPPEGEDYCGAGTVGSTEACLLAGLALKLRWRAWYGAQHGVDGAALLGERPNLVISTMFQACWEKFFRYMDVEPRLVTPEGGSFTPSAAQVWAACDHHTIGVVCILGNHYTGHYDPVSDICAALRQLNTEKRCVTFATYTVP